MAQDAGELNIPVKAKAVLIDPTSMTVLWMNESARQDITVVGSDSVAGTTVDQAIPMAEMLGLPEALRAVADTGVGQHLRANLVSTTKGSVAIVTSVYRLPGAMLLVLTENAWQPAHGETGASAPRRSGRRAR